MVSRPTTRRASGGSGFQIRKVETKADRKRPSVFMRLKVDEAFKAHALFEPDPELQDNPGYFEYYDHWDQQGNSYVPCAGEKCPFCAANMNPSTRALTAWYDPAAADVKDRLKIFTMNYSTTQDITDESEDEDGILGKMIRIKRLEPAEKGNYKVKVTSDKPLTQTQLKAAMKELEEKFPDGLEGLVQRQLVAQIERLKAMEAMEDEDEDEEDTPAARPGRAITAAQDEEEEDEEEDEEPEDEAEEDEEEGEEEEEAESESDADTIEDLEAEILRVSRKNNSIFIEYNDEEIELIADEDELPLSDYRKGDTVTVSALWDEDEEVWSLVAISSEDEQEEEEDEEDEQGEISGATYEVVKVQQQDEIFDLVGEDGTKVKMWLGDGLEVDYEVVKKGTKLLLDAVQDDEGDWIITSLEPQAAPARRRTTKAASKPAPRRASTKTASKPRSRTNSTASKPRSRRTSR